MTIPPPPQLAIDGVRFAYRADDVLRDVSFSVEPGEFVGVIGPNGAGKTTMLRLLTGQLHPAAGTVRLGDTHLARIAPLERARLMAVVPQNETVVFSHTVEAMVLLGRYPHASFFGYERDDDYAAAREAMRLVGVEHLATRSMTELSGGEQHRVFIARALAQQTPLLLLDEPNAHLDLRHQSLLFELLSRLQREDGRSVLIITHDLNLAGMYCDRILLLSNGRPAAWGTPADVLREDIIGEHFGVAVRIDGGDRPHVRLVRS